MIAVTLLLSGCCGGTSSPAVVSPTATATPKPTAIIGPDIPETPLAKMTKSGDTLTITGEDVQLSPVFNLERGVYFVTWSQQGKAGEMFNAGVKLNKSTDFEYAKGGWIASVDEMSGSYLLVVNPDDANALVPGEYNLDASAGGRNKWTVEITKANPSDSWPSSLTKSGKGVGYLGTVHLVKGPVKVSYQLSGLLGQNKGRIYVYDIVTGQQVWYDENGNGNFEKTIDISVEGSYASKIHGNPGMSYTVST